MVAAPNIGLLLDIWDVVVAGGSLDSVRNLPPQQIVAVHVADLTPAVGNGEIDEKSRLACPTTPLTGIPGTRDRDHLPVTVEPGKSVPFEDLKGPRAITGLRAKLDLPPAPADRDVLRELALEIKWDGEQEPSVWAPLGDFFGTAGDNIYRSLPLGHNGDEWWYGTGTCPSQGSTSQVVQRRQSPAHRHVGSHNRAAHRTSRRTRPLPRQWHRDAFLPTEPERQDRLAHAQDQGPGRFVGVMLHVWNPRGGWWGEGDEKFFVDGEKFPSTFGTGSEDYFGYAWCSPAALPERLSQPDPQRRQQPRPCLRQPLAHHRQRSVPQSFEGDIEKYYPNQRPTLYAATAYWYLAPGGNDPIRPCR